MSAKRPRLDAGITSETIVSAPTQSQDQGVLSHKSKPTQDISADDTGNDVSSELPPVPYTSEQRILIVGDGNLSWARALCVRLGTGSKIIATTYENESELLQKYPESVEIVRTLKESYGATVAHDIDATQLLHPKYVSLFHGNHQSHLDSRSTSDQEISKDTKFDRIIFMFPLVPLTKTLEAHQAAPDPVISNKLLIWKFLRCAAELLEPVNGEIHIASKDVKPYTMWRIPDLADDAANVAYLRCEKFDASGYPGYETRKPTNNHFDRVESFPLTNCWTYVFHRKIEGGNAAEKNDATDAEKNLCNLCKKQMTSKDMYESHLSGKKHGLLARIHARFSAALKKEGKL